MTIDPVLVVGAGPVGLVAACHLARLGVPVTVVEALDIPTTESRAVGVHARSAEMLATLGVLDALEARGRRIGALQAVRGHDGAPLMRIGLEELPTRHPYVLDVAQPDTEAVLAARAVELGVTVRRGVALVDLRQDDDGVDATLRRDDGDEVARVGWVVGADGGHSRTRHLVGTRLDGVFHGQHFAMADAEVDTDLDRDTIWMFTHSAGPAMLFPLAGRRARVMFAVADPGDGDLTLERVRELAAERTGGHVAVGDDPRWLAWFEVHHGQVPQYRHGRVLLAGDAAHIHSPAGAQGMNTGIQDAANLAWKLALVARGQAAPTLLDSYHDERHPVGAAVVRNTTRLTDAGTGATAPLREAVMRVVGHLRPAVRLAATELSEVALDLRGSRLSVQEHRAHRDAARAGDHVPDPVGLRRSDGTPVAVEELLAERPGLVALVWEPDADATRVERLQAVLGDLGEVVAVRPAGRDDAGTVVDPEGVLARALGLEAGGLALVRPDGYLALVTTDTAPEALERYLTDVLEARRPAPVPAATA